MTFALDMSIRDALKEWAAEAEPGTLPLEKFIVVTPQGETGGYVVFTRSLLEMQKMGLDALPLDAIAFPQQLVKQPCRISQSPHLLDLSRNLSTYFSSYLTAGLYELQSLCRTADMPAYIIGGQVRDILLNQDHRFDVVDVDITVEANAIEASQRIVANSRNFTVEECFPEFGTATLLYKDDVRFDLASTRSEHYTACGALPTVDERGVPLWKDIGRRDFTVNTLAMSIHSLGQVLDYAGGLDDIEHRVIRILHPLSFYEDPSRILRALKFLIRLNFTLDPLTEYALHQFMRYGATVYPGGGDRIRTEMLELFGRPETEIKQQWMTYFYQHGLFRLANMAFTKTDVSSASSLVLAPAADVMMALSEYRNSVLDILVVAHPQPEGAIDDEQDKGAARHAHVLQLKERFLALFHLWWSLHPTMTDEEALQDANSTFRQICKRLEITRHERELLVKAWRLLNGKVLDQIESSISPIRLYQICQNKPVESLLIAAISGYGHSPKKLELMLSAFHRLEAKLRPTRPLLKGDELMALGVAPGEAIGNALEAILFQKLLGRLKSRDDEATYITSHVLATSSSETDHE